MSDTYDLSLYELYQVGGNDEGPTLWWVGKVGKETAGLSIRLSAPATGGCWEWQVKDHGTTLGTGQGESYIGAVITALETAHQYKSEERAGWTGEEEF